MLWSHVLDAAFNAPANKLDCVPASHLAGDVLVDAAGVVFKVRVDGEGSLDWATFHDHLLNGSLARSSLDLAIKSILGILVRASGVGVALLLALCTLLRWAACSTLGWVRVLADRAVVVAVRKREILAHALAEWARALKLFVTQ